VSADHRVGPAPVYDAFDNAIAPVLTVEPGATVEFDCPGPPLPDRATPEDVAGLNHARPHRLIGPVAVRGAEPGDTLVVEVLDVTLTTRVGHTFAVPPYGLLGDEFDAPYVHSFDLTAGDWTQLKPGVRIPLAPFLGIMGVAPGAPGEHSTLPPRATGGNLDVRHLTAGSTLFLPVEAPGALFSCGDGHAAQGDGEVCLTGLESGVRATLRLDLRQGGPALLAPQLITPNPLGRPGDEAGHFVTMAPGPDLYAGARSAIRQMIEHLVAERGLTREEAYVLCSLAVDLKISEIVDAPNWVVSAYLPLTVFAGA
jgi:acetamidase/formamidase